VLWDNRRVLHAGTFYNTPLLYFGRRETNAHLAMTVCCLANK
jgi:alpha-ketoglutarate-dependent taurine dioxygenase